eukprot:10220064-Ditylum_brightwellii.AAC.1
MIKLVGPEGKLEVLAGEAVVRVSEYTGASGQIEHYNLKMAMPMFVDILNKLEVEDILNKLGAETMMLDIVIDGDLQALNYLKAIPKFISCFLI